MTSWVDQCFHSWGCWGWQGRFDRTRARPNLHFATLEGHVSPLTHIPLTPLLLLGEILFRVILFLPRAAGQRDHVIQICLCCPANDGMRILGWTKCSNFEAAVCLSHPTGSYRVAPQKDIKKINMSSSISDPRVSKPPEESGGFSQVGPDVLALLEGTLSMCPARRTKLEAATLHVPANPLWKAYWGIGMCVLR